MFENILKYLKYSLCCVLSALLSLSFSYAYPDVYYYDNYLVGQSPYTIEEEDFSQGSIELWESYFPSVATDTDTGLMTGLVTTFSDKFMSGTSIPSAVPLINVDILAGRTWTLNPGECFILYSKSGEYYTIASTSPVAQMLLGTTYPTSLTDLGGYAMDNTYTRLNYDVGYSNGFSWSWVSSNFTNMLGTYNSSISLRSDTVSTLAISPYSWSKVVLVYNPSNNPITFYHSYYDQTGGHIDVDSIPLADVHWIWTLCHTGNDVGLVSGSRYVSHISVIPHIKGSLNLYSFPYHTVIDDNDSDKSFYIGSYYEQIATVTFSGSYFHFSNWDNHLLFKKHDIHFPISYLSSSSALDLVPVFLDDDFFTQLYHKALYIRNGYIDITNYDQLIAKLQEAGIGSGDLSQVISLLEQINSGGDTGEAVASLIGILDGYHDSITAQGDTDWNAINNTFDLYKYLLDFSADSIHWIVIANNALFNYFSGFIILCAFFLILDRVMRG